MDPKKSSEHLKSFLENMQPIRFRDTIAKAGSTHNSNWTQASRKIPERAGKHFASTRAKTVFVRSRA
jgi:hypothetical protein